MTRQGMTFVCVMDWAHGGVRSMIDQAMSGGRVWPMTFSRLIPGAMGTCLEARIQTGSRIWGRRARPVIRSSLSRWTSTAPCGPVVREAELPAMQRRTQPADQDRVYSKIQR